MAIPTWNFQGVIPPVDIDNPASVDRSPYGSSLLEFVQRFATTEARCRILIGFLNYREALHALGLVKGFQWIDGSFVEDVERMQGRAPRDVDVVTFVEMPAGSTQISLLQAAPGLFPQDELQQEAMKQALQVDGYTVFLEARPMKMMRQVLYWSSLWSHNRYYIWKGFIEISMDSAGDAAAKAHVTAQLGQLTAPPVPVVLAQPNIGGTP